MRNGIGMILPGLSTVQARKCSELIGDIGRSDHHGFPVIREHEIAMKLSINVVSGGSNPA